MMFRPSSFSSQRFKSFLRGTTYERFRVSFPKRKKILFKISLKIVSFSNIRSFCDISPVLDEYTDLYINLSKK